MPRPNREEAPLQGRIALIVLAAALGLPAAAIARDFDHPGSNVTAQQFTAGNVQRDDTPNDPGYDASESDDQDTISPRSTNLYDERFDLFGFPSEHTRNTTLYAEGPNAGKPQISGFNAAGAWKLTRGEPSVAVAILDTGIRWDREALRTKVRLNKDELPLPEGSAGYDANHDGVFNVDDYASDSRVNKNTATGVPNKVDAVDLIKAFSDGNDDDGNGYVDDIAGWDFFDDDNNPYDASSYSAAANHGSGRAEEAAGATNDGDGDPGVCPKCQLVPLRVWDTFVSDQNSFAQAVVYAADNDVSVIEGADGGLYHSRFAEQAVDYAYSKGLTQTYSGDDLNTGNHNYPAAYNHTMLIQGTAPDTLGLGTDVGNPLTDFLGSQGIGLLHSELPVGTYFRGASTTQYGGHSSISMEGATGSENTGKASGAAAMVISAALEHQPAIHLRADETRAILEQTAEDVTQANTAGTGLPDQAQPGFDVHFGYGRVNLGAAVSLANGGKIPGEAAIYSPAWYAPLTGASVDITGLARARFATNHHFTWKLEWGPGLAPTTWNTVRTGSSSGTVTDFGSIDLNAVRTAMASYTPPADAGMPTFAPGTNPYKGQFSVRVTVDGDGLDVDGVDRKVLTAIDDPTLVDGFPKKLGAGGEAPIQYADVDGDGTDELIVPLEDGTLHVYEDDGSELPGFPVHTGTQWNAEDHLSSPGLSQLGPPPEPLRGVAVADLDDDGTPELISAAGTHVYVWEPDGSLRDGFPVEMDRGNCKPLADTVEHQELRHPKCGFLASPAVGRLEGKDKPADIVIPALDGRVYAFDGDGHALPHYPVQLVDPTVPDNQKVIAESINNVAIGDLDKDGTDDVVAASNEVYGAAPPTGRDLLGLSAQVLADLLANVTDTSTRVYAINGKTGQFFNHWPIKLNGGIQNVLPLIGPGHDPAIMHVGDEAEIVVSSTGGALSTYDLDGNLDKSMQQSVHGAGSTAIDGSGALNLFESASVGDIDGSGKPSIVKYNTTLTGAANLLLVGQNFPWQHQIGAFDPTTGAARPGFPVVFDDYQFLSSSTIAKMRPGASNQVVAGSGLGLLHAYDGKTGLEIPEFPKVTGGWLFAPATLRSDGKSEEMAGITREGYLFRWRTQTAVCQGEWPDFRHDPHHTGNYDADGRPPAGVRDLALNGTTLSWKAPGDDGICGTAKRYEVFADGDPVSAPAPEGAGTVQSVAVPAAKKYSVRAVDDAGERRARQGRGRPG